MADARDTSRFRVLVVESERRTAMRSTRALRAAGYEVAWSSSEERALARLAEGGFAALVVHLDAPRIDGLGVVGAVRAHEPTRSLPIVALTEGRDEAVEALARFKGCDRLLAGPPDPRALLDDLARLVVA